MVLKTKASISSIQPVTLTTVTVFLFCLVLTLLSTPCQGKVCPRDKSRVVAQVVREKIFRAFNALQLQPSSTCQFALERDMFGVQEDHKVMETAGRWTCNFCGKSFITEFYLDRHFENRHPEHVQTEDVICLADVCDVFRCDILSGVAQPDYWDIALCLEDDMQELALQCQAIIDGCIPLGLTTNETETLKGQISDSVCSYLTCSRYWDRPFEEESSTHLALYIVLTTMTVFGIIIYNFVFYNYFYSDLGDSAYDPTPRRKHRIRKYQGRRAETTRVPYQATRHRGQYMEAPS